MVIAFLLLAQADELQDVLRQLREERSAYYQRQRSRQEAIDAARQATKRLEGEVAELKSRDAEAAKQLAEVNGELDVLRKEDAAAARLAAELAPALDQAVKDGRRFVEEGFDYRRKDRLARLDSANESLGERAGRYWGFLQEELRIARSGEAYSAPIPLDGGRVKPARVFRVGHLLQGFVTEDALEAGYEVGKAWKVVTPDQAPRDAVEILDRRRAPSLLRLPVKR